MKSIKSILMLLSAVVVLANFQTSVSAQVTDDEARIAAVSANGSIVRWQVAVPHAAVTMTVSAPDGQVYRKEFKNGSTPEFMTFDKEGNKLADGQYQYELRMTPLFGPGVKDKLASGRSNNADDAATERDMRKKGLLPQSYVQSGTFTIIRGSVVVAGSATESDSDSRSDARPEPLRPISAASGPRRQHHRLIGLNPDQVIPDDLIVQGSACVGLDCVNNESFGFDTIKMKENNTRIKFEDTSVGTFPSNDWQLTANDSASGAASKFSIEDITGSKVPFTVTAGAATNSMFVDSIGRVGFRTSTPVLDLHVNTSNTPGLRLEQNNSGGFVAQTWDVAGNEANFFVRDITGGSKLSLRIRPGAPTSSVDIAADGNVGIGTASPDQLLEAEKIQDAATIVQVKNTSTGVSAQSILNALSDTSEAAFKTHGSGRTATRYGVTLAGFAEVASVSGNGLMIGTVTNATPIIFGTNSLERMRILSSGNVGIGFTAPTELLSVNGSASKPGGGSWSTPSDERLKNIKGPFSSGLKALMQLQPIRYEYKSDNALKLDAPGEHVGFGAQAVQKIIPEAVTSTKDGYLQVNNDPIILTMLNAIKEQQKQIEELQNEVRQLRAERKP